MGVPARMQRSEALGHAIKHRYDIGPWAAAPGAQTSTRRIRQDGETRIGVDDLLAVQDGRIRELALQARGGQEPGAQLRLPGERRCEHLQRELTPAIALVREPHLAPSA